MATTLYDLSVLTFLQTLRSMGGVMDRAAAHCAATGADPEDFVGARLYPDMAPFHFQIEAAWHHAVWGVEAAKTGAFAPPALVGPAPFGALRAMMSRGVAALEALSSEEVNSWAERKLDMVIYQPLDPDNATTSGWGPRTLALTPETFLLTYSLPNFYFHMVTAYNILRTRGVPIGKYHFQGQLRVRMD
ncbi:MAG TPA: DUF1993 domain-containing protein [Hyphomonas sp.]|nr:DUF1993 domain-containing protein [Hyphomonas sp.]HRJ02738.1 DUF1993 domain-containing protein [Hyphomonas sp.]HRK68351.1 DUF1993 domain-containing protein [Hyphomonas sp.]